MKIIHTADWHLGNYFHRHSREEEHRHFLDWLLQTLKAEQPDALLMTGDLFDSPNPPAAAEKMFFGFLHDAVAAVENIQIVITAGNHDSGHRLEAPEELLRQHNIYVRGTVHRTDDEKTDYAHYLLPLYRRDDPEREARVVVFAVPYLRSSDYAPGMTQEEGIRTFFDGLRGQLKKSVFKHLPVIAAAHFYASGAEINELEHSERLVVGGQDKVAPEVVGKNIAHVALGHIHKAQQVNEHVCYAGAPVPMSFSEKHYRQSVWCMEVDGEGTVEVSALEYRPLRRLISIPQRGAAEVKQVLEEIDALPKRQKNDTGDDWPYLEIKVKERQPEPSLLHEVTAALEEKAVHFCRMTREAEQEKKKGGDAQQTVTLSAQQPLEIARRVFRSRYNEDMPKEMLERFQSALKKANEDEDR